MKKSICTTVSVVLVILMLCMNSTVFAVSQSDDVVSERMKDIYDQVFAGNGEVYDANGKDITDSFVKRFDEAYKECDYESIFIACINEKISEIVGYQFSRTLESSSANATRSAERKTYSKQVAHLVTNNGSLYPGKTWYIIVIAEGAYTVGYAYPSVVAVYNISTPTISVDYSGEGAAFQGTLNSMSVTTPVIGSSGRSFSFSVTTKHSLTCPIPGSEYITGTLGPFTNVSYFSITA